MKKHSGILVVFAMTSLVLDVAPNARGQRLLWGDLAPGPYSVGFQVRYKRDPSRAWAEPDSSGVSSDRPIRISVWYPANPRKADLPMRYRSYFYAPVSDPLFRHLESMLQYAAVVPTRDIIFAKSDSLFQQLLDLRTSAFRDAVPAVGKFPLIAYSEGYNNRANDNSVIAEYLASHGFVVVTVPQVGPRESRLTLRITPADLETQARDLEFAIGDLKSFPNVERGSLGLLGYSMGGVVAMWIAGRNSDVKAIGALDPSFRAPRFVSLVTESPYFDPRRLRMPILSLQSGNISEAGAQDTTVFHRLELAPRSEAQISNATHADFSDFAAYASLFPLDVRDRTATEAREAHNAVARYLLAFFNGTLKGDSASLERASRSSDRNGMRANLVRMKFRAGVGAPSEEAFIKLARSHGMAAAVVAYREAAQRYPDVDVIDQPTMNRLGYGLLESGRASDAVVAFQLNVEAHPGSADVYDSLADALLALGDRTAARRAYQKLLEVLDADQLLSADAKTEYRRGTEAKLRNVAASPSG